MKSIEFTLPLLNAQGPYYQVMVVMDHTGHIIGHKAASTVPNWKIPNQDDRPNLDEYPVICEGQYDGVFKMDGHHGKIPAIILEDNGPIPVYQGGNPRFPNQGKHAIDVHIHEGGALWRGSAACPTLSPGGTNFMEHMFDDGEKVLVTIPSQFWFVFEGR